MGMLRGYGKIKETRKIERTDAIGKYSRIYGIEKRVKKAGHQIRTEQKREREQGTLQSFSQLRSRVSDTLNNPETSTAKRVKGSRRVRQSPLRR